jgi:hypothetical protein
MRETRGFLSLRNTSKKSNMFDFLLVLRTSYQSDYNSPAVNVDGYSLVSSPRCTGRGGGVAAYVRNSVLFSIKDKSSNNTQHHSIDYLLLEIPRMNLSLSCVYIPPNTPLPEIISTLSSIRLICNPNTSLLIGGDFNINLLDTHAEIVNEFLNEVHTLSLHPVITLPTRVTDTTATLIDNFLYDLHYYQQVPAFFKLTSVIII